MSGFITEDGAAYLMGMFAYNEQAVPNYYVALCKTIPAPFMIASDLDEPDVAEYVRAQLPNDGSSFEQSVDSLANAFEIAFPVALSDWGSYLGWALLDQEDIGTGRVLYGGDFGTAFEITEGLQAVLAPGQISISISVTDWALEI